VNAADKNQAMKSWVAYVGHEITDSKYWSKPKGDSAENDWQDYGKQLVQDIMPEIKIAAQDTGEPVSKLIDHIKTTYLLLWKSRRNSDKAMENALPVKATSSEYEKASSQGKEIEHEVGSTKRGGYEYQGYFYFHGKTREGPQKVKIEGKKQNSQLPEDRWVSFGKYSNGYEIMLGKKGEAYAYQIWQQGIGHIVNSGLKFKSQDDALKAAKVYIDHSEKEIKSVVSQANKRLKSNSSEKLGITAITPKETVMKNNRYSSQYEPRTNAIGGYVISGPKAGTLITDSGRKFESFDDAKDAIKEIIGQLEHDIKEYKRTGDTEAAKYDEDALKKVKQWKIEKTK
jgi:hypothetical protein